MIEVRLRDEHGDILAAQHADDFGEASRQNGGLSFGKQSRLIDQNSRLRNSFQNHALLREGLAERNTCLDAAAGQLERALRQTDQTHAVVNTSGAETGLGDLKPPALAEQNIIARHAHLIEDDFHVTVGCIVIAEHAQGPQNADAGGAGSVSAVPSQLATASR